MWARKSISIANITAVCACDRLSDSILLSCGDTVTSCRLLQNLRLNKLLSPTSTTCRIKWFWIVHDNNWGKRGSCKTSIPTYHTTRCHKTHKTILTRKEKLRTCYEHLNTRAHYQPDDWRTPAIHRLTKAFFTVKTSYSFTVHAYMQLRLWQ